jgi:hypothetical protein
MFPHIRFILFEKASGVKCFLRPDGRSYKPFSSASLSLPAVFPGQNRLFCLDLIDPADVALVIGKRGV